MALMFAVFLDVANYFMPVPMFSPLFLKSDHFAFISLENRKILLGLLMGLYGFAQLFGGPFFGRISDRYGRKRILTLSLILSFFSTILGGLSLYINSIPLIYLSRLLLGLSSGTIALAFAITSNLSDDENRAKNIGYITIGTSLGSIFGPGIGGHLSSNLLLSIFGSSTPFYLMSLLYLLAISLVMLAFKDTHSNSRKGTKGSQNSFFKFNGIMGGKKHLFGLIILILLFQVSCESFFLASPILLTTQFGLTSSTISNYFILQGSIAIFTSFCLNKILSKMFTLSSLVKSNIILLLVSYLFLLVAKSKIELLIPFIGVGVFGTLCWIHINCLLSKTANADNQGIMFGISQAIWGIASTIGPIFVGLSSRLGYKYAGVVPTIFICLSLLFSLYLRSDHKNSLDLDKIEDF